MKRRKEIKLARTEIDRISLKALLELVVVERDDAEVTSVATTVDIAGDFGRPIEVPDDTLVGVAPGGGEELEEVAQLNSVLLRPLQSCCFSPCPPRLPPPPPRPRISASTSFPQAARRRAGRHRAWWQRMHGSLLTTCWNRRLLQLRIELLLRST